MITWLSNPEKEKFSQILYSEDENVLDQIETLSSQSVAKLRAIQAQKIAYQLSNTHIGPPSTIAEQSSICQNICCCFYPKSYTTTFGITTQIFLTRTCRTFLIWKDDFLEYEEYNYEVYGALWLTLTYMIILGTSANVNQYFYSPRANTFREQIMGEGVLLTIFFKLVQPLLYRGISSCFDGTITLRQSAMLTGYSMILYYLPTIMCFIPSSIWHVIMLLIGAILRWVFLFRNFCAKIQETWWVLAIIIGVMQLLFFLAVLLVMFKHAGGASLSEGTSKISFSHMIQRHFDI